MTYKGTCHARMVIALAWSAHGPTTTAQDHGQHNIRWRHAGHVAGVRIDRRDCALISVNTKRMKTQHAEIKRSSGLEDRRMNPSIRLFE